MSDRIQISEQPSTAEIQLRNEGFKVARETPHRGEEDQPMSPEEERRKVEAADRFTWVYSAQTLKLGVTGRAELDSVAQRTARRLCDPLLQPGAAKVLIDQAPLGHRVSAASRGHLQTRRRRLPGEPAVQVAHKEGVSGSVAVNHRETRDSCLLEPHAVSGHQTCAPLAIGKKCDRLALSNES